MRIGIDLGGTKIEGAVLDDDGAIRLRERHSTPRGDYAGTLHLIRDIALSLEARVGPASIGIGIPGTICPFRQVVKNANSTWLNGRPLDADLRQLLGREVRLANDANCFALSEAVDGAGAGADPVFGVILGTGVGGGIVVGKRVLEGAQRIAGEWGHNPLPAASDDERAARPCYCGRHGCIETFLSGPASSAEFRARTGRVLAATEIAAEAESGDLAARAMMETYSERLARALASVVNIVDPEVIVLGGGLSKIDALYSVLPEKLAAHVFSPLVTTRILAPAHGDSSGVRGAAWLWPRNASECDGQ
jgi:fructokinase